MSILRLEKPLPHNHPAERALLGCILAEPAYIAAARANIGPDDMTHATHKLIYQTMLDIEHEGQIIDLVTLKSQLANTGTLDSEISIYISSLLDGIPNVDRAETYAREVREAAKRRAAVEIACHLATSAYSAKAIDEALSTTATNIIDLASTSNSSLVDIDQAGREFDIELTRRRRDNQLIRGYACGIAAIDAGLRGFRPGKFYSVGGYTSAGKTVFASQLSKGLAQHNSGAFIGYYALEMDTNDIYSKWICNESNVPNMLLDTGMLTQQQITAYRDAKTELEKLGKHLRVNDETNHISAIEAQIRMLVAKQELDIAVIDYAQLLQTPRQSTRELEVNYSGRRLVQLAKELNIVIIATAQTRSPYEADPPRDFPMLDDFRESKSLAQHAHAALLLHRPECHRPKEHKKCEAIIYIAKNRSGSTYPVHMHFNGDLQRFEDLPETAPNTEPIKCIPSCRYYEPTIARPVATQSNSRSRRYNP